MSEVKEYPLEYSLLGTNTVYIACESVGRRCNYAICANILKAMDEGRRKPDDPCSREIKNNLCEAKVMRAEEVEAGYAIHYAPRVDSVPTDPDEPKKDPLMVDRSSEGFKRGWGSAGKVVRKQPGKVVQSKPSPVKMPTKLVTKTKDVTDFGSAVSQAMKEEIVQPVKAAQPKIEQVTPPIKKKSALERARRIRAGG